MVLEFWQILKALTSQVEGSRAMRNYYRSYRTDICYRAEYGDARFFGVSFNIYIYRYFIIFSYLAVIVGLGFDSLV